MSWTVTWEDHTYRETDLTIAEAEKIVEMTGESWLTIHPLRSPRHLAVIIAVLGERQGCDYHATLAKVRAMPVAEALELQGEEDADDLPYEYAGGLPLAGGGPGTAGSSGAPNDTDGPPPSPEA